MSSFLGLTRGLVHAPDGSGAKLAAMVTCHCGASADGEKAMGPLKAFGTPAIDAIGPMPYSAINSMLDDAYPKGARNYWRSSFLADLSDAAIDTMIACFAECPTPMGQLLIEHFHGAATRVGVDATAFPHRREGYNFLILAEWMERADDERCIAWARETSTRMQPFMATARYVNYLGDDETDDALAAAYGPQLSASTNGQGALRPNQLLSTEPEHPSLELEGTTLTRLGVVIGLTRSAISVGVRRPGR
jgi:hypothetical protein